MSFKTRMNQLKEQGRQFNNAAGTPNNTLSDFGRVLIAKMSLVGSTAGGTARLFGYMADTTVASNAENNAVVNFAPVTHSEIIKKLGSGGSFRIGSATYNFAHNAQAAEEITITRKDITGAINSQKFFPESYRTAKDFNTLLVDLVDFQVPVDECTYIDVPLNIAIGANTVTLTMTLVDLLQSNAALFDKSGKQSNYTASAAVNKERVLAGSQLGY